jgi:anthranilate phosphoribosyltransferase
MSGTSGGEGALHWPDVLMPLIRREDLTPDLVGAAMATILDGNATDAQIAAFAVALRAKGETAEELAALVRTMLAYADKVEVQSEAEAGPLIDTCGTGGDRSHTFNISTTAALVVAGTGVRVAKHGNRAASSQCGSADVLESLGVVIDLDAVGVARCIDEVGIGFCFAQKFHPALRYAGPMRSQIGVPTTFNFLGPLANPARVHRQMVGVGDPAMATRIAAALVELGSIRAMVFFGHDGLDELTTVDSSTVLTVEAGTVSQQILDPTELGLGRARLEDLRGGDAVHNATMIRSVLEGESGPTRDVVLLNAASALQVAGTADSWSAGIEAAAAAIDDGRAAGVLEQWIAVSNDVRAEVA